MLQLKSDEYFSRAHFTVILAVLSPVFLALLSPEKHGTKGGNYNNECNVSIQWKYNALIKRSKTVKLLFFYSVMCSRLFAMTSANTNLPQYEKIPRMCRPTIV